LLVDDFAQWRLAARSILKTIPGLEVVGEAANGLDAIEKATTLLPHIVLLDIGLPLLNGIEVAKEIRILCPETKIIFLTQDEDQDVRSAALATGAEAYILKSRVGRELRSTIEKTVVNRFDDCVPTSRLLRTRRRYSSPEHF
jgi:DNA-binding NarL/FixJ family response regulator